MLFGKGHSTLSKCILLRLCVFQVITVTIQQIQQDDIHLSGPSGEFTSPGYPSTTDPIRVQWNITVDEDCRIILQFLDFGVIERDPCMYDVFLLDDGPLRIGRWCCDSVDKLNYTTYISSGNVFILTLRISSLNHSKPRKGFRAYYSSIPKEAAATNTVDSVQPTKPDDDEIPTVPTTSTQNVPKQVTTSNTENVPQTAPDELPNVPNTSTQNAKGTSNVTVMTSPTSELDGAGSSPGVFVAIFAGVIVIIIFVLILVVWKYKMNNQAKKASPDEHSESSSRTKANIEMYEEIKKETNADIKGSYENTNQTGDGEELTPATDSSLIVQQSGVYSKEIFRQGNLDTDTPDGTYEKPDVNVYSYADPNELKLRVK